MDVKYLGSKSDTQYKIEDYLIKQFERKISVFELRNNDNLILKSTRNSYIVPDVFSEKHKIIGEVHVHNGILRSGQKDKISSDILKMLLYEKDQGTEYEKHIIICGESEKRFLEGDSYIAAAVKMYHIKVDYFVLPKELLDELDYAAKQQNLVKG